ASVKETSLTSSSFAVHGSQSGPVNGSIAYDDPSRTATFKPLPVFKDGEMVTVDLGGGIQAKSGAGLRGRSFTFQIRPATEPEPPPPPPPPGPAAEVTSRDPASGSWGVARDATIHVDFSLPMDPLT